MRYNYSVAENERKKDSMSPILDVLPTMIANFAENARVSTGFRLLKRCLRHALDPKAFALENTTAHFFEYDKNGDIGLVLTNRVAASMKETTYHAKIAFTSNELVAAQCDCPAGGCGKERVICVHNLPLIYQFVMLLDDGLSEHLLVELCSRWDQDLEDKLSNRGKTNEMKDDIKVLMQCAGEKMEDISSAYAKLTVREMLETQYATGTQRSRQIPTPPPVKSLRPIRDLDFSSLVCKAKKRKMNSGSAAATIITEQNDADTHENQLLPPDYFEVYTSILAFDCDPKKIDFPGYRLLQMRSEDIMKTKSESTVSEYVDYKKSKVSDLIKYTYSRIKPVRDTQLRTTRKTATSATAPTTAGPATTAPTSSSSSNTTAPTSSSSSYTAPPSSSSTTTAPTSSTSTTTAPPSSYTAPTSSSSAYTAPTSSTTTAPTTLLCNPTTLQPPIKKKWQRGPRQKCCFPKCEYNERTDPKIKRITNLPKNQPPLDIGRLRDVKRFLKKKWERQLTLHIQKFSRDRMILQKKTLLMDR